jgi:arginyl-tRNA synthetase
MIQLKQQTAQRIADIAAAQFPGATLSPDEVYAMLEYPPDAAMGDLALPCFKLSKSLRRAPVQISDTLAAALSDSPLFARVESVKGYLNFFFDGAALAARVIGEIEERGDTYGSPMDGVGKTVVLDYSSPNVAKPFHIGHLGTTVIGHSLKLLHKFAGWNCVGINYLGDWGTQFGKLIVAYKKWGDRAQIEAGGIDRLVELYVKINNAIDDTPEGQALADQSRAEFHKMELGDEENIALWKWFVDISLKEYEKTYRQLGITFDSYKGESFYTDKMPAQVELLRQKGLLKIDDGASVVDLEAYGMPPCLILKRDGSTLYPTRDIAAAVYRKEHYHFDRSIYVTSAQQCLHFRQWFKVVELMGYPWYGELVHVPYGTVSVNGAKLATRTGNVVLLRDLFAQAIEKVSAIMTEKNPALAGRTDIAEQVGVGAVVFYYLSGNRMRDINFTLEDALSFEGNTGPYAQYTYARTCSVLRKYDGKITWSTQSATAEEGALAKVLAMFPERVKAALAEYEPSVITRYILDLCAAFNRFYHECPILSCEDGKTRESRVALTAATRTVLGTALHLICMATPEQI